MRSIIPVLAILAAQNTVSDVGHVLAGRHSACSIASPIRATVLCLRGGSSDPVIEWGSQVESSDPEEQTAEEKEVTISRQLTLIHSISFCFHACDSFDTAG